MPVKRLKHHTTKKNKSKSMKSIHSIKNVQNQKIHNQQKLIDLITMISQARKNKNKSRNNLPARLMKMSNMEKPRSYEKSISSSYSSIMHNGEEHNKGKEIINDSTKPFIQINEMKDGEIQHYMVPKNTISYNKPTINKSNIHTGMPNQMSMPIHMSMQIPKTPFLIYSKHINKPRTKKTRTKKTRTKKTSSKKIKQNKKSKKTRTKKSKKSRNKKSKKSNK
jgi:hypothetical protein